MKVLRNLALLLGCFVSCSCTVVLGVDEYKTAKCTEGATQCAGNNVQTCIGGTWSTESVSCGAHQTCKDGACSGACGPGEKQCNGNVIESCDDGNWQQGVTCQHQVCNGGVCIGICAADEVNCNGQQPQTCDSTTGQWVDKDNACDKQTCAQGACMGVCAPGERYCKGLTPWICENGEYVQKTTCDDSKGLQCSGGACVQSCIPGDLRCNDLAPEICGLDGLWQPNGPPCDPCVACDSMTAACKSTPPVQCGAGHVCGNGACVCSYIGFGVDPLAGKQPTSIATADFDKDGRLDIAITNGGGNDISVLLGKGKGMFFPKVEYPAGVAPSSVVTGDFNGDGWPDLAAANQVGGSLSVFINQSDGTFMAVGGEQSTGGMPSMLVVADFDNDQNVDLIAANGGNKVTLLHNDGMGMFSPVQNFTLPHKAVGLTAADFNNDTKVEIVAVGDNKFTSFYNDGSTLQMDNSFDLGGLDVVAVQAADLDIDNVVDLVFVSKGSDEVWLRRGVGDGSFDYFTQVIVNVMDAPSSVAVADFNADLRPDIVVASQETDEIAVLPQQISGSFNTYKNYAAHIDPAAMVAADFDNNGFPDLAIANHGSDDVSMLLGSTDGSLVAPLLAYDAPGAGLPWSNALGDFNEDSKLDLALTVTTGNPSVGILLGNGLGSFTSKGTFAAGMVPQEIEIADVNNDLHDDLVVTTTESTNNVGVLLGKGDGTFFPWAICGTIPDVKAIAVADIDNDNNVDLVVAGSNGLNVALGHGDGTFDAPSVVFVVAGTFWSIAVADFNNDGRPDLAVANTDQNAASVLIRKADGSFAATNWATGSSPRDIAIADLNSDGRLDIVTANVADNTVSVLLNEGNDAQGFASFSAKSDYAVDKSPVELVAVDFDNDGKIDIAAANQLNDSVSVLLNKGQGILGTKTNYSTGGSPRALVAGDFNGDGGPDLAIATYTLGTNVTILFNSCSP